MIAKSQPPKELDASKLEIRLADKLQEVPGHNSPEQWSQSRHSDHILTVEWNSTTGWSNPLIKPYENLSISPVATCLNYATTCFEGMKVYRGYDGKARLFRPDLNAKRMLRSAERICLPSFDTSEMEKLLVAFSEVEAARWAPSSRPGTFFYLRPVMIGTQGTLALQPAHEALFYVVAVSFPNIDDSPIPAPAQSTAVAEEGGEAPSQDKFRFLKTTSKTPGLRLLAEAGRAWPGSAGSSKVGSNYGPTLLPAEKARSNGYDQVLWLCESAEGFEKNPIVMEAGGSNFFVVWKTTEGKTQLITASLDRGLILPGVTRQSILDFVRENLGDELEVKEMDYGIEDLIVASKEGRLLEAFAAGTAYFVSAVKQLTYRGIEMDIPVTSAAGGKYTETIRNFLLDVQYGKRDHEWAVVLNERK